MTGFVDLTGKRFERLTVTGRAPTHITKSGNRVTMWNCICDCGKECVMQSSALRYGAVKSCGCYKKEVNSKQAREMCRKRDEKAGMHSREKLYSIWNGMMQRCYNKNQSTYPRYGGSGITVCDEWRKDYVVFKDWAISSGWKNGLSIDRIDNSKGYAPDNCRWVTMKQQQNKKTVNRYVEMNGEIHTFSEWADILHINYSKVYRHASKGLSGDELYQKLTRVR